MSNPEHTNINDLYLESYELETTELTPIYRTDLRTQPPDIYVEQSNIDWSRLSWQEAGKPYVVGTYSAHKRAWEASRGMTMPVPLQWQFFNRNFHKLFTSDLAQKRKEIRRQFLSHLRNFNVKEADETLQELIRLKVWNHIHHKEDAIWDPRGKRKLFDGLEVKKPNILVLGAGDGYDAMLLLSLYAGGHAVMVDFDDFCRAERFGEFPEEYPFLGKDPRTGYWAVYNKEDFNIDFEVADIADLKYGKEFDIVLSVGLVDHYPEKYKPLIFHFHRQFLKPGGYAIITTFRDQVRLRTFYQLMRDALNYGYRELMNEKQLGLYAYENGFKVLRCGYIKAHNCIIAKER